MATTQTKTPIEDATAKVTEATKKVAELNEKAVENGKKLGLTYVDAYEKAVLSFVDSYEKAASQSKVEWLETAVAAQAGLTRELTKAYTAAARELVA